MTYTVKRGDTIYGISRKFGVSVADLIKTNNLTGTTLTIGQILKIPGTTTNEAEETYQTYTVQKGDTIYGISKKLGVTAQELIALNNIKNTTLTIGQILKIPGTNKGSTESSLAENGYQTYIVKTGDTIYGISNQFGVAAIDISNLNNLGGSTIYVGQVLKIPTNAGTNPSSLFTYTVEKGDSLYNIARRYDTTVDEIMKLNHLTSTSLQIGQQLQIPENGEETTSLPSYTTYIVKKGDSIYAIARTYNTTVNQIMQDNGLKNTSLSIGQELKIRIPTPGSGEVEECFGEEYTPPTKETTYIVQKGDSLYTIAKKFDTSVTNIKNKNNLTSNTLQIGQVLKI